MYRILQAEKDGYINNKYIGRSPSTTSNVGQAGTLDLYKLYDETTIVGITSSIVEYSKILVQFDYGQITGSINDLTDPSFKCFLSLKDVYGGQTTPSNFKVVAYPLSASWDEGRGSDVISYRDLDTANFLSSSYQTAWILAGANQTGSLGDVCDYYVSGNIGNGNQYLGLEQMFNRGDEDLLLDITAHVSASVAGYFPNNGYIIQLHPDYMNDQNTYFVKRFGSKQAVHRKLRPRLIFKSNEDRLEDDTGHLKFDTLHNVFLYNIHEGSYSNIFSGSVELTGSSDLAVRLETSRSVCYTTGVFSITHSASITVLTSSFQTFAQTFEVGKLPNYTGIYTGSVNISSLPGSGLFQYNSGTVAEPLEFKVTWLSADETIEYARTWKNIYPRKAGFSNMNLDNVLMNITNLKKEYSKANEGATRLRVFAANYDTELKPGRRAMNLQSVILTDLKWRLVDAYSKTVIIPFDTSTLCSYDEDGMWFDIYTQDLEVGTVYEIQFLIDSENGKNTLIEDAGFKFKIVD